MEDQKTANEKIDQMIGEVDETGNSVILDSKEQSSAEKQDEPKGNLNLMDSRQPTPQTQQPAKAEPQKTDMSYLTESVEEDLSSQEPEPEPAKQERNIPVHALQEERRRRQAAERELAQVRVAQQQSAADADNALNGLIENEDDLIDGKTAKKLLQQTRQEIRNEIAAERQAEAEQRQAEQQKSQRKVQIQAENKQVKQFIDAAAKEFADFDATVSQAYRFMSNEQKMACRRSADPGSALYAASKQLLSNLGIQPGVQNKQQTTPPAGTPPQNQPQTPENQESVDSDDMYAELFGESRAIH